MRLWEAHQIHCILLAGIPATLAARVAWESEALASAAMLRSFGDETSYKRGVAYNAMIEGGQPSGELQYRRACRNHQDGNDAGPGHPLAKDEGGDRRAEEDRGFAQGGDQRHGCLRHCPQDDPVGA